MSDMSYCFRDLETVGEEKRKSAILLALVAGLDDLKSPNPAEAKRFSELFIPLFKTVPTDIQRQAISALSRSPYVPANVAEFVSLLPLDLSAPFLTHSPSLTGPILCYVIASTKENHGRLIAKRDDLHKRVIQSLLALDDQGVNRALQLKGYVSDAAIHLANSETRIDLGAEMSDRERRGEVEFFADHYASDYQPLHERALNEKTYGEVEFFTDQEQQTKRPRLKVTFVKPNKQTIAEQTSIQKLAPVDTNETEDNLRDALRQLVSDISVPVDPEALVAANLEEKQLPEGHVDAIVLPILEGELRHRRHTEILTKHIENSHVEYFTTSLADALGSSYLLAERIVSDMTGRQLALTFNAILLPEQSCILALNKFFPHVSIMEGTAEGADALIQNMKHGECLQTLTTWVRADKMSVESSMTHVAMSEADIDYSKIEIGELPSVKPVSDNTDRVPEWPEKDQDADWLSAIAN